MPINLLHFGADDTGQQDASTALQNAINAAAASGLEVYIPPGRFLIRNRIDVKFGVSLRGEHNGVVRRTENYGLHYPAPVSGWTSTFITTNTPSTGPGTFILQDATAIRNCAFFQSGHLPNVAPGFKIPTVFCSGVSTIEKVEFVNTWQAVRSHAPFVYMHMVVGQPIIGIEIDGARDGAVLNGIGFDSPFDKTNKYRTVMNQSGIAFIFRSIDGLQFTNGIAFEYLKGLVFAHSLLAPGDLGTKGTIMHYASDQVEYGIEVDSHGGDLRFINCNTPAADGEYLARINTSGVAPVVFSNCSFGTFGVGTQKYMRLSNGNLRVHNCSFNGTSTSKKLEYVGGRVLHWSEM